MGICPPGLLVHPGLLGWLIDCLQNVLADFQRNTYSVLTAQIHWHKVKKYKVLIHTCAWRLLSCCYTFAADKYTFYRHLLNIISLLAHIKMFCKTNFTDLYTINNATFLWRCPACTAPSHVGVIFLNSSILCKLQYASCNTSWSQLCWIVALSWQWCSCIK